MGFSASGSCSAVGGAPDSAACWSCGDGCHLRLSLASFSAILYLNGDFEGGAFYFTKLDAKTETVSSSPPRGTICSSTASSCLPAPSPEPPPG